MSAERKGPLPPKPGSAVNDSYFDFLARQHEELLGDIAQPDGLEVDDSGILKGNADLQLPHKVRQEGMS